MDIDTLKAELLRDEGLRLKPYKDSLGYLTIGVGRCLDTTGITQDEAVYLLGSDIARTIVDLDRSIPWWESLDEVRQRVMVNMAFNLGIVGLCGFTNTLQMIHDGRYGDAADGMLASPWARQVGHGPLRLAELMRTGTEPKGVA